MRQYREVLGNLFKLMTDWVRRYKIIYPETRVNDRYMKLFNLAAKSLRNKEFVVVVCGSTSSGKSSLINYLVGVPELLPKGIDTTTSCVSTIRYGAKEEIRIFYNDNVEIVNRTDLEIIMKDNVRARYVKSVDISLPCELLRGGLVIKDTPGVGDRISVHTYITKNLLMSADAVLLVHDVSRGTLDFDQCERDYLLNTIKTRRLPLLCVLAKSERISQRDQIIQKYRERLGYDAACFVAVSSLYQKRYIDSKDRDYLERSNFESLKDCLKIVLGKSACKKVADVLFIVHNLTNEVLSKTKIEIDSLNASADNERKKAARLVQDAYEKLCEKLREFVDYRSEWQQKVFAEGIRSIACKGEELLKTAWSNKKELSNVGDAVRMHNNILFDIYWHLDDELYKLLNDLSINLVVGDNIGSDSGNRIDMKQELTMLSGSGSMMFDLLDFYCRKEIGRDCYDADKRGENICFIVGRRLKITVEKLEKSGSSEIEETEYIDNIAVSDEEIYKYMKLTVRYGLCLVFSKIKNCVYHALESRLECYKEERKCIENRLKEEVDKIAGRIIQLSDYNKALIKIDDECKNMLGVK